MRHVKQNQITSISADSQDGNFPADNLLDGRPGRLWKAGGLTRNATLTMEMRGGVSDVALFGTNAREATATVEDPCAVTFGDNPLEDDGDDLVVYGTFDSSTYGWTGYLASITVDTGRLKVTNTSGYGRAYRTIATEAGEIYRINFDYETGTSSGGGTITVRDGDPLTGTILASVVSFSAGAREVSVKAASATMSIILQVQSSTVGHYSFFDNVTAIKTINMLINGEFSSDRDWTKGTGWTISGSAANAAAGSASSLTPTVALTIEAGKKYRYKLTVTRTAGSFSVSVGGATSQAISSSGVYIGTLTAVSTASFSIDKDASFAGSVDSIDLVEVSADELKGGDILKNTAITTTATTTVDENGNALRVNFNPAVTVPCTVRLNATSPGNETLYAGVAFGGTAETYGGANFRYGAGVGHNDYSIVAQNATGSRYYKKRAVGKQYNLTALMLRTEADKLEATIRQDGAISSAWALFDNSTEMIFGWPQLQRSMDHRLHDNIQLTITEEI